MAHFGFLCPPYVSHIRTFEALGEELVRRGHRATFILNAGGGRLVRAPWARVAEASPRAGDPLADRVLRNATRPGGLFGAMRTIRDGARLTGQLLASGPDLLRSLRVDAVVGDQLEPAAGLLAACLQLPHVSLACALPINPAPGVPLPFLDWPYDPTPKGLNKAQGAERIGNLLMRPHFRVIEGWSRRQGMSGFRTLVDCLSGTAQISQVTRGFDFPRPDPIPFEAVGPIRPPSNSDLDQPLSFEPDGKRPLVFATMGTLQGGRLHVFKAIARACRATGAELVVAHGGLLTARQAASIDADHVHGLLPQRALLRRADLCVSHAGLNTTLDCLEAGLPQIVRPIAFDQKGATARLLSRGLGERMAPLWNSRALAEQIRRVLVDRGMRERCRAAAVEVAAAGGVGRAADIVEAALQPAGSSRLESP